MTITLPIALLGIIVFLALPYLWGCVGRAIRLVFPRENAQKGDKVAIYLNGRYNRTATLSNVEADCVYIYDKVKLPLDYRGKFYGVGYDPEDGSRLVYVTKRKHYRLVRVAEIVRKVFFLSEDEVNLNPDHTEATGLSELLAEGGQAEE